MRVNDKTYHFIVTAPPTVYAVGVSLKKEYTNKEVIELLETIETKLFSRMTKRVAGRIVAKRV